jgi:hypothetical protein
LVVNVCVKPDTRLSAVRADDYDALIILAWRRMEAYLASHERQCPGTHFCGSRTRNPDCRDLSRTTGGDQQQLLPKGTHVTAVEDILTNLENAKFSIVHPPVMFDEAQRLIRSPNPETASLKAFCERIGEYTRRLLGESL